MSEIPVFVALRRPLLLHFCKGFIFPLRVVRFDIFLPHVAARLHLDFFTALCARAFFSYSSTNWGSTSATSRNVSGSIGPPFNFPILASSSPSSSEADSSGPSGTQVPPSPLTVFRKSGLPLFLFSLGSYVG